MKNTEVIFALSAVAGFGPATEFASPNQPLQRNDPARHASCGARVAPLRAVADL